jgi:hypothetical protein
VYVSFATHGDGLPRKAQLLDPLLLQRYAVLRVVNRRRA